MELKTGIIQVLYKQCCVYHSDLFAINCVFEQLQVCNERKFLNQCVWHTLKIYCSNKYWMGTALICFAINYVCLWTTTDNKITIKRRGNRQTHYLWQYSFRGKLCFFGYHIDFYSNTFFEEDLLLLFKHGITNCSKV